MDKLPPHDVDAEMALLGSVLLDDEAFWQVRDLNIGDFFLDTHRDIWRACCAVGDRSNPENPLNQVTVGYELGEDLLERCGGRRYLLQMIADCPTSLHVESYRERIQQTAVYRRLISYAGKLAQQAYERRPLADIQASGFAALTEQDTRTGEPRSLEEIRARLADQLEQWGQPDTKPRGVLTGFPTFDQITRGFKAGELIIVAGRPSMGKSMWALTASRNVALGKRAALLFSLEMDEESLYERLYCQWAGLDATEIDVRGFQGNERQAFREALDQLDTVPLRIDESAGLSVATMRARLMKFAAQHPTLGLVTIDYLNIISGYESENEVQRLDRMCRELRDMARQFQVPVMLVCQLNRGVEERQDKRPLLSDLRGSGGIEQHADLVLLLYRDDYYTKPLQPSNLLEVHIAKQRKGPTRTVKFRYVLKTGAIEELDIYAEREQR